MGDEEPLDLTLAPEAIRAYLIARNEGTLRGYYLYRFRHLKGDYSDELPATDVRIGVPLDEQGHFVGDRYKCKGNYIFGLSGTLQSAVKDGVITDSELVRKIEEFRAHDFQCDHGERTTSEEIAMINRVLTGVITYLE